MINGAPLLVHMNFYDNLACMNVWCTDLLPFVFHSILFRLILCVIRYARISHQCIWFSHANLRALSLVHVETVGTSLCMKSNTRCAFTTFWEFHFRCAWKIVDKHADFQLPSSSEERKRKRNEIKSSIALIYTALALTVECHC